ncbi:MAG: hypothetical protein WC515_05130 [Candidatus Omnitrophota bacterium]
MAINIRRGVHTVVVSAILSIVAVFSRADTDGTFNDRDCYQDIILKGAWEDAGDGPAVSVGHVDSHVYSVHTGAVSPLTLQRDKKIGYGGALNLKYYSGIPYEDLRRRLPGKTIYVDVRIPKGSMSPNDTRPSRLRVCLKSEKNGEWAEYSGDNEWITVGGEGRYEISLKVPERPVKTRSGAVFSPEETVLFCVEHYMMEGEKTNSNMAFSFTNLRIEGIALDPGAIAWQFMKDGHTVKNVFLQEVEPGSSVIKESPGLITLRFDRSSPAGGDMRPLSCQPQNAVINFSVSIPEELRNKDGSLDLTLRYKNGKEDTFARTLDSCDTGGNIHVAVPILSIPLDADMEDLLRESTITLTLKLGAPLTSYMMPVVIGPIRVASGILIPFDTGWRVRDIQGLGGYTNIDIKEDGITGDGGVTVKGLGKDLYQLDAAFRIQGGLDWKKNRYYRVELIRDLENGPVNMDNLHIEVLMSPAVDNNIMEYWQKPYRARIGLQDINGNFIFGPNISLSEGVPNLAYLDVSVTNPMPKGITTGGFDPTRVKTLIINFEGPHVYAEPRDIKVSIFNFLIRPREHRPVKKLAVIDYSRFRRDQNGWQITKIIRDAGGYLLGINYPFPAINVSKDILEVPQVYPAVGMKAGDPMHLGISSAITRQKVLEDFRVFASNDLNLTRVFLLGHLDGVFRWGYGGKDITGFEPGAEKLLSEASRMDVEELARFLRKNEDRIFGKDADGRMPGLEKHVFADFLALLDILEQVEKDTGKRVMAIISLYDFMLGDGAVKEGPGHKYAVGEHPEIVTDPAVKVKAHALIWKIMKRMSEDRRFYRYIALVEIMNEPENANVLATKEDFPALVNFVGEGLYLLKDAMGPSVPVSAGFRCWYRDLMYWTPVSGGIDILMTHYWESLESYNINNPSLWPMDLPVEELWKALGTGQEGRLTGMEEIGPFDPLIENLFTFEKAGYDLAIIWSYSGHDGYDAKPALKRLSQYQRGNRLFAEVKRTPAGYLKDAFSFINKARAEYDAREDGRMVPAPETPFNSYLRGRAAGISDERLKDTVLKVLAVATLKEIPLERANIDYLAAAAQRTG